MSDQKYYVVTGEAARLKIDIERRRFDALTNAGVRLADMLGLDEPCNMASSRGFVIGYAVKAGTEPPPGFKLSKYPARGDLVVLVPGGRGKLKKSYEAFLEGVSNGLRGVASDNEFWDFVGIDPSPRLVPGYLVHPVATVLNREAGIVVVHVPEDTEVNHPDLRQIKKWEVEKMFEEENEARAKRGAA